MRVTQEGINLWSLSGKELAEQCLKITEQAGAGSLLQDEARRLYMEWQEVRAIPDGLGDRSRKAVMAAGLRRRTIQILAKEGLKE
jgi:hypothetical protein